MDKAKKKRLKSYIAWISLAALVVLLAVMPLLARQEAEEEGPVASILEDTVQMTSLETGLRGGGTLSPSDTGKVELPDGVKITGFLVKNGDTVSEGDPVAEVDKVSVLSAILRVRETLDYLREEMADAKSGSTTSTVKATAGGRVKQVFAQAGDDVQDVMLRHGALAVLSLDGRMSVELEADTLLAAGDPITLTFADGTAADGRVESNLDGILIVSVEDKSYEVGAEVEVSDETGASLGKGSLTVHNAWKAVAYDGTVSSVSARENTDVYAGSQLFTLKDGEINGQMESLAAMHRDYEELLQELFAIHASGVLTAPCGGKVSGVDEDSEYLLSAIDGEAGWFVDLLENDTEETGWTVMLLSNTEVTCTGDENCTAKQKDHEEDCPMRCTGLEGCTAKKHETGCAVFCTGLSDCANLNHKTGCLGVCTGNDLCRSTRSHEHHEGDCIKRCISDPDEDPESHCDARVHYPACIENCTEDEECTALTHKENCPYHGVVYTAVAAKVNLVALEGLLVIPGTTTYQVAPEGEGWVLVEPDKLQDLFVGEPQPMAAESGEYQTGDILLIVTGTNSQGQAVYQATVLYERPSQQEQPSQQNPTVPGMPNMNMDDILAAMGGSRGGFSGFGGMTQTQKMELYPLEKAVLMTVTEQNTVKLNITVDEQDIGRLQPGMPAQVKVNALKGRTFEAEVTEVGSVGTNNGGSSKFTVELTMAMEPDMLTGMSATAWIPLYTKMDVLTVPVAALVEKDGKTFLCTALDPETGEPSVPVEVKTGISDGSRVEILSGLGSGDTVYYSYYDTLELDTNVEQSKYTFG